MKTKKLRISVNCLSKDHLQQVYKNHYNNINLNKLMIKMIK